VRQFVDKFGFVHIHGIQVADVAERLDSYRIVRLSIHRLRINFCKNNTSRSFFQTIKIISPGMRGGMSGPVWISVE
jgi:hypothetical protein